MSLEVPWIGGVFRKGLTELQAAEDPKDKPHHVVQRQDCVDHVISCDPSQRQHLAHLQQSRMCDNGRLWEPLGMEWAGWVVRGQPIEVGHRGQVCSEGLEALRE